MGRWCHGWGDHLTTRGCTWHVFENKMTTLPPPPPTLTSFLIIFLNSNEVVFFYLIAIWFILGTYQDFRGRGGGEPIFFKWHFSLFIIHHVYPEIFFLCYIFLSVNFEKQKSSFNVVSGQKYSHNLNLSLKLSTTTKVSMLILYYQVFIFIWEKNAKSSMNTFCLLNAFD